VRIVDGYALDAVAVLGALAEQFTANDLAWVLEHSRTLRTEYSSIEMCALSDVPEG
jgi:hypothetical protein